MKRHYLTIAAMTLVPGMTACSSKANRTTAPTTTQAQTTEAATASAEAEDDLEEDYSYGFAGEISDKIITIAEGEDKAVKFDITNAEITGADAIDVDDEVEVTFNGETSQDAIKAKSVEIIMSAVEETETKAAVENDEIISGIIEKADDKTVALKTEDGTYTFSALITRKVTKGGIKADANADMTFYGDLRDGGDKPVVTKIVTEDAKDMPDVKVNALAGKIVEVKSDYTILDTVDPENTLFTLLETEGVFDRVKIGDTAIVTYEDTLTDKAIRTTGIE